MTKAILLSVRPEHALNILNKTKTLELRKSIPKGFKGWVYVYVTKAKPYLNCWYGKCYLVYDYTYKELVDDNSIPLNGKVPMRFWFDEYVKYVDCSDCSNNENGYECENDFMYLLSVDPILRKETCLTSDEIEDYGKGKDLYAWHIKKLELFHRTIDPIYNLIKPPLELSEFYKRDLDMELFIDEEHEERAYKREQLTKAPQSWQYVYREVS